MASVTVAAPRSASVRRPGWARRWVAELGRAEATAHLERSPCAGSCSATRRGSAWTPSGCVRGACRVRGRTRRPYVRRPTAACPSSCACPSRSGRRRPCSTSRSPWRHRTGRRPSGRTPLTAAEPFFWNGSDAAMDIELGGSPQRRRDDRAPGHRRPRALLTGNADWFAYDNYCAHHGSVTRAETFAAEIPPVEPQTQPEAAAGQPLRLRAPALQVGRALEHDARACSSSRSTPRSS